MDRVARIILNGMKDKINRLTAFLSGKNLMIEKIITMNKSEENHRMHQIIYFLTGSEPIPHHSAEALHHLWIVLYLHKYAEVITEFIDASW